MDDLPVDHVVYVVDDEPAIRNALKLLLGAEGFMVETYSSANTFLDGFDGNRVSCIIMDIQMPGGSGLECQDAIAEIDRSAPLLFLTGHGDIPTAVKALQKGAIDFLEKPILDEDAFLERIRQSLTRHAQRKGLEVRRNEIQHLLETLTSREREVVDKVAAGEANKVIAIELGISERTVEIHRARGMHKLGVHNVAQLLSMLQVQSET